MLKSMNRYLRVQNTRDLQKNITLSLHLARWRSWVRLSEEMKSITIDEQLCTLHFSFQAQKMLPKAFFSALGERRSWAWMATKKNTFFLGVKWKVENFSSNTYPRSTDSDFLISHHSCTDLRVVQWPKTTFSHLLPPLCSNRTWLSQWKLKPELSQCSASTESWTTMWWDLGEHNHRCEMLTLARTSSLYLNDWTTELSELDLWTNSRVFRANLLRIRGLQRPDKVQNPMRQFPVCVKHILTNFIRISETKYLHTGKVGDTLSKRNLS